MMQVKILKNENTDLLERDINEFLKNIGTYVDMKVELKDIKYVANPKLNETYSAMVIYNITRLK